MNNEEQILEKIKLIIEESEDNASKIFNKSSIAISNIREKGYLKILDLINESAYNKRI